jgi:hypothetical protein
MSRANPFDDLSDFAPKASPKPVESAQIERLAQENGFPSRQAKAVSAPAAPHRRRYKTGRNQQLNIKATSETVARFYHLADDLQVPLAVVLEQALAALERQKAG